MQDVTPASSATPAADPAVDADVERVWRALETVRDPCHEISGHDLSIVDLGLVNWVARRGDAIHVSLTFTEPTCVFAWRIVNELEDLAPQLPGVARVEVVVEHLPIWEPDRMNDRARTLFAERRDAWKSRLGGIPVTVER